MRLTVMELTLGLPSGFARSEIGTLPVRGPPVPPPTTRAINGQARAAWAFPRFALIAHSRRFLHECSGYALSNLRGSTCLPGCDRARCAAVSLAGERGCDQSALSYRDRALQSE